MPEANENNAIVSARNTKQPDNNKRDATPYTLINKRKSHPKKHSISDEELLIKFNEFFLFGSGSATPVFPDGTRRNKENVNA